MKQLLIRSILNCIFGTHSAVRAELVEATNGVFERALVYLHKMPRIWLMWLEFFAPQARITCRE